MNAVDLYWLPECPNWKEAVSAARQAPDPWLSLMALANTRVDFVKTNQLDNALKSVLPDGPPHDSTVPFIRLAVLASSTVTHLLPALRVAALRRNLFLEIYVTGYGQYRQELLDPTSPLRSFAPNIVLFALDARHMVGQLENATGAELNSAASQLTDLWRLAQTSFKCQVLQQTILPVFPPIIGSNEHRLTTSNSWRVTAMNNSLRSHADASGVDLVALDTAVQQHGLHPWYDSSLWHKGKQEIHPAAAPMYGELVLRVIAPQYGRSSKCLVLDLDNTLWGGVIGDDGLDGIVLGQGSALGEAFIDFQRWVVDQARRGIILAVCSKNDEVNALAPFAKHPDMAIARSDIAVFVANWMDKPTNLRAIAKQLNIGLESLVFVDDNPFERNIVRRELPMVAVPELHEDPALYARCIADAGYFDAVSVTADDMERTRQYRANIERQAFRDTATDLDSYLSDLEMQLWAKPFDAVSRKRIVQLINKTNQFNLTTRRYTDKEVEELMLEPHVLTLHFRLTDCFGDNGIVAIIIARKFEKEGSSMIIDTWLMSCRVLGRQVEEACMNVLADMAKRRGVTELIGEYIPTAKNNLVRGHYEKLRFSPVRESNGTGLLWRLPLNIHEPFKTHIAVHEG